MIFDRLFERRASLENPSTSLSDPANWLFNAFGAQPTKSNIVVTERNATQLTAFWSAINTISDTLGEMPVRLVRNKRDGSSVVVRNHAALDRIKTSPNPMMSPVVFKSTIQAHILSWGNGYAFIKRNAMEQPIELWPLLPSQTRPFIKNGELFYNTTMSPTLNNLNGNEGGQNVTLQANEVLHMPALSRGGIVGMSIIGEQREMLGAALTTQNFGAKFFANGAHAGGLISFPGKVKDPAKTRDQIETTTGGDNAHRLLVLDGDAKYTQFSIPPDDAQFLQTREFDVDEIGRMFRLPLHFLNKMGQATFNNLEMMGAHFVQYTMMPWITRWEQELTRKLLLPGEIARGLVFKFNVSALIRGDIKTRSEVYAKGITNGWITRNEVRGLEDLNPLDGLDDPLVPLNLGVVGEEPEPEPEPEPVNDDDDAANDDDDENEDARMWMLAKAAAERCASREALGVRKILAKGLSDDELADALEVFYTRHQEIVQTNLAMDEERAKQHCIDHAIALVEARETDQIEEVILVWQTDEAAKLATEIIRKEAP